MDSIGPVKRVVCCFAAAAVFRCSLTATASMFCDGKSCALPMALNI